MTSRILRSATERALAAVLLLGTACGDLQVPVEYVKWDEETAAFGLGRGIVTTFRNRFGDDVESPYEPMIDSLNGHHVVVAGGGSLLLNFCRQADPQTVSREEFYRLGVITEAKPVNLQLSRRLDGTWFGVEHDSISMLTAYVNFDNAAAFFRDVIHDDTLATTTRARIAFYGEMALGCGNGRIGVALPVGAVDNAAFVGTADMFIVLRDAVFASGIELGANPGVAAHEYSHRIWQHNVFHGDEGFRLLALSFLGSPSQQAALCVDEVSADGCACKASGTLLKAMDEGTADIFAYTLTGRPAFFFDNSLAGSTAVGDEDKVRDLSREPVIDRAGSTISTEEVPFFNEKIVQRAASTDTVCGQGEPALHYYRLGTLWSRGFYRSIVDPQSGNAPADEAARVGWARAHYAPAVRVAESRVGDDFTTPVSGRDYTFRFEPRQLIRRYIEEVSVDRDTRVYLPAVHDAVCQEMCNRFGYLPFDQPVNGVPAQCSGFMGANEFSPLGVFPCQI
ncbi:MAG: hypothetical protein HY904_16415 [Deltaproteobacteria bacterium]|nr:hypothetical protein [Deltaproteobacteria bacterium]